MTPSTGYDDVHLVALARLLVPVTHVQVDWQRYGPKLAQVALTFGADDLDDGVVERRGGRRPPAVAARGDAPEHQAAASSRPVERRALFVGLALMAVVRIGAVSYLNARPLVVGLESRPERFEVRYDLPSTCARAAARRATSISD